MLEIVAIALLAAVLASFLIFDTAAEDAEDEAGQPWADAELERILDE